MKDDFPLYHPSMLTYRKAKKLRVRKFARPEGPFWPGTMVFPYAGHRSAPLSIDAAQLSASGIEKGEVEVADDVADLLSREQIQAPFPDPVVIESTGFAESVFRGGEDAARCQLDEGSRVMQIISADGAIPRIASERFVLTISGWPFDLEALENLFAEASRNDASWGVWVPVLFPMTTDLGKLDRLAEGVVQHGGRFLAASTIDLSPTAKSAIAREVDAEMDDEMYDTLFHSDPEPLGLATERHIAALARERGLADLVALPGGDGKSNWNAAVLLSLAGSRIARMKDDPELGWTLLRSAGIIAGLNKPLSVIAESAPLSIIEGVDPIAAEALESWLRGGPPAFLDEVDAEWRLRRDAGWES